MDALLKHRGWLRAKGIRDIVTSVAGRRHREGDCSRIAWQGLHQFDEQWPLLFCSFTVISDNCKVHLVLQGGIIGIQRLQRAGTVSSIMLNCTGEGCGGWGCNR